MLVAENLTKIYGRGDIAVRAVNNVSFEIEPRSFVGIVGASGSGKSTLLHILSTLDTPTSGSVLLDNEDIYRLSSAQQAALRRKKFGFVFQFFNLVPTLTVRENIILPLLMDGADPDMEHINKLIDRLGIKDKVDTFPGKLSGGQQQRVAIARALAAKPVIVFADEPTGNLDSKNSKAIIELFKSTASAYGQTLILVTHDSSVAAECTRVVELKDGVIVSDTAQARRQA